MKIPENKRAVVLIDVDGTLVEGPSTGPTAGLRSMNAAAFHMTGVQGLGDQIEFAGRTDMGIAKILLTAGGKTNPTAKQVEELLQRYVDGLERFIEDAPYLPIGDAPSTVPRLTSQGYIVGLGTGNLKTGTAIKLESAGLLHLFDIDLGGYGDDGEERNQILHAGIKRCDPNASLPVVIVGDTPRDVIGAKLVGAKCIGIPHGNYDQQMLLDAGADAVTDHLGPHLTDLLDTILGG